MKHRSLHRAHHFAMSYPTSMGQRVYTLMLAPVLIVGLMYVAIHFYPSFSSPSEDVSLASIITASLYTLGRITIAYIFAVIIAIPLSILAVSNSTVEEILLPIFDVLESIPILAIFPVIIVIFIQFNFLNGAAIFILFLNMLWNLVFAIIGGLKIVPRDITDAAHVFGLQRFSYIRRVLLPAIFPQLVTGSILAVADGWNIVIVAEALHTYMPHGAATQDLFGIGSLLISAATNAENSTFLTTVFVMVIMIALINFFVWQKLLHLAQRFRFE